MMVAENGPAEAKEKCWFCKQRPAKLATSVKIVMTQRIRVSEVNQYALDTVSSRESVYSPYNLKKKPKSIKARSDLGTRVLTTTSENWMTTFHIPRCRTCRGLHDWTKLQVMISCLALAVLIVVGAFGSSVIFDDFGGNAGFVTCPSCILFFLLSAVATPVALAYERFLFKAKKIKHFNEFGKHPCIKWHVARDWKW